MNFSLIFDRSLDLVGSVADEHLVLPGLNKAALGVVEVCEHHLIQSLFALGPKIGKLQFECFFMLLDIVGESASDGLLLRRMVLEH